jgi:hypothetical protein
METNGKTVPFYVNIDASGPDKPVVWGMSKLFSDVKAMLAASTNDNWTCIGEVSDSYRQTAFSSINLMLAKWANDPLEALEARWRLLFHSYILAKHGFPAVNWFRTDSSIRLIHTGKDKTVLYASGTSQTSAKFIEMAKLLVPITKKSPEEPVDREDLVGFVRQVCDDAGCDILG